MTRLLRNGLAALAIAVMPATAAPSNFAIPEIDVVPDGDTLGISGRVVGLGNGSVKATLRIIKSDGSGRVQTSQSRQIEVTPGSSDIVASTKLSRQDDLSLSVTLILFIDDVSIASTTTTLGPAAD